MPKNASVSFTNSEDFVSCKLKRLFKAHILGHWNLFGFGLALIATILGIKIWPHLHIPNINIAVSE